LKPFDGGQQSLRGVSYRVEATAPALKAGRAALESIVGDKGKDIEPVIIEALWTTIALEIN
jgi:hypothetical protein